MINQRISLILAYGSVQWKSPFAFNHSLVNTEQYIKCITFKLNLFFRCGVDYSERLKRRRNEFKSPAIGWTFPHSWNTSHDWYNWQISKYDKYEDYFINLIRWWSAGSYHHRYRLQRRDWWCPFPHPRSALHWSRRFANDPEQRLVQLETIQFLESGFFLQHVPSFKACLFLI